MHASVYRLIELVSTYSQSNELHVAFSMALCLRGFKNGFGLKIRQLVSDLLHFALS